MGNFIESFAKVQKNKVCPFVLSACLSSSSIDIISYITQDLFSQEPRCVNIL